MKKALESKADFGSHGRKFEKECKKVGFFDVAQRI
jgi:hypothetical protein